LNSRLDTIQAGVLLGKFETFRDEELDSVNHVAKLYSDFFDNVNGLIIPNIKDGAYSSWAQYTVQLPAGVDRSAIQSLLKADGIPTNIYYIKPMHLQGAFKGTRSAQADCPVTEQLCKSVLCLPIHPYLADDEIEFIARKLVSLL